MGKQRTRAIRFHVPFTAEPPAMTSAAVGIVKLKHHGSQAQSEDVTLLDAPDNRCLRSGVVIAHRVSDGQGEWTLEAPNWSPWLPSRRVEPVAEADLPADLAKLVLPITRGVALGPVATLSTNRAGYSLLGEDDVVIAGIRDEQVTLRRGGIATARYREVTLEPGPDMTPQQIQFVIDSMQSVSASPVDRFPTLQQRLGPPATGLTDFPEPQPVTDGATMEELVISVFARDLVDLVEVLLGLEASDDAAPDISSLNAQLQLVLRDIRGLAHVLDPGWRESVDEVVAGLPFDSFDDAQPAALKVVDALVSAVHAPRLGDSSMEEAGPLLFQRAEKGIYILADRCRALEPNAPGPQWEAALQAAEQLALSAGVAAALPRKSVSRILGLLDEITSHLRACSAVSQAADLEGLDAAQAYALGRSDERRNLEVARCRQDFVAAWPDRITKLRKLLAKAKAKAKKKSK